jgi:hypothetical protein
MMVELRLALALHDGARVFEAKHIHDLATMDYGNAAVALRMKTVGCWEIRVALDYGVSWVVEVGRICLPYDWKDYWSLLGRAT